MNSKEPGTTKEPGTRKDARDRRLMAQGFLLISIALVIGSFSQWLPNPRMGLATHLEGLTTGMLLLILGLAWTRIVLPPGAKTMLFWMPILGSYCSVVMHLFAAIFPSGNYWMPIAAKGVTGTLWQEGLVTLGIMIIGATLLPTSFLAAWGLWSREES